MNIKLKALWLGGSLALSVFFTNPILADEWNKKTEFQFSAPVQIPGKVLAAGKYVFQLADSESDRNIVQVFSEDSNGNESLVATVLVIPDYRLKTPDKSIINFEERQSGTPQAIHSWFYPGDNTGWEFVYPKGESLESSANTTPGPAPVETAAAAPPAAPPALPPAPQVQEEPATEEVTVVEEGVLVAQNDALPPPSAQETDTQNSADRTLPETAGYSHLGFLTGLAMLGGGIATVFAARRKVVN